MAKSSLKTLENGIAKYLQILQNTCKSCKISANRAKISANRAKISANHGKSLAKFTKIG